LGQQQDDEAGSVQQAVAAGSADPPQHEDAAVEDATASADPVIGNPRCTQRAMPGFMFITRS
jgi:hypothetical protein